MKVSVLLCVYNPVREQLLAAVRSITGQSFTDWEMILVDDGSDETHQPAIEEAAHTDPRIRLFRKEKNGGLAAALNDSIEAANGEYFARMDGDDLADPERFKKQYDFLEENGEYMWAGSCAWLIDDDGIWGRRTVPERPEAKDFLKYSPYIHSSVMFRAEVFEKCGGYKVLNRGEDYELFMRLHSMGMRGYNLQEELQSYREDLDSYRHRTFRSALEEVQIRRAGFQELKLRTPLGPFYDIRPLVAACVPRRLLARIKRRNGEKSYEQCSRDRPDSSI